MNIKSNYTTYFDSYVDQLIQNKLDEVIESVISLMGNNVYAIVLYGGFGRGEGSVEYREGKFRIINDFDILVLTKNHFILKYAKFKNRLNNLSKSLAKEMEMKLIDLSLRDSSHFSKYSPLTIYNYELKYGSKTLFGDFDMRSALPNYDSRKINLDEGTTFFIKRGAGLLIAAKYLVNNMLIHNLYGENFIIETQKAIIAVGDSMLLEKKEYHYSYSERLNRFKNLEYKDGIYLKTAPLYEDAISNKLKPNFEKYLEMNFRDFFFLTQKIFNEYFYIYEQQRLNIKFKNWVDYSQHIAVTVSDFQSYITKLAQLILSDPKYFVRIGVLLKNTKRMQRAFLLSTLPLLLFSLKKNGFDEYLLKKACNLFNFKYTCMNNNKTVWNHLVNEWLYYFAIEPNKVISDVLHYEKLN